MSAFYALHLVLSAALFWTCFCRQARATVATTRAYVRGAFWVLSVAAIVVGVAPYGHALWPTWFDFYVPGWPDVMLLAAIVGVQAVTAVHWRHGVPEVFQLEAGATQWPWAPGESSTLPPLRDKDRARLVSQVQELQSNHPEATP